MAKLEHITCAAVPDRPLLYSQAIKANGFLFLSGQGPIDAEDRLVGEGDVVAQTRQAFLNIKALAEAAGASMADVIKLTIYLTDRANTAVVRPVRAEFFTAPDYPALTVVGNIGLASPEWLVEIEAVIALP
jgi:2-iminobutanoate/2-iminopropanoate deaminase